ncbi:hypothetical protein Bca52824_019611 [Brassica carinata]|uniref:Uncharacterized protein n=1 Tax=Brassica carinata TaxID=52824 RepID=A0A8X7VS35_BRACI|nr:hypothetical protein Bca52824_019611 [Brassica carinata]
MMEARRINGVLSLRWLLHFSLSHQHRGGDDPTRRTLVRLRGIVKGTQIQDSNGEEHLKSSQQQSDDKQVSVEQLQYLAAVLKIESPL